MNRFLADAMLGSVARKLRIFGFDTLYLATDTSDNEILRIGIEQQRVIITADRELFKRIVKQSAQGVLVEGTSDLYDMAHIFSKLGISAGLFNIGSRCTVCNGTLYKKMPLEVDRLVPANVLSRHKEFWQCTNCSKVYWDGGHLGDIRDFARKLERLLDVSKG
jgi:uncharacterized protein with PIN domain